jgi:hypothetical protein
MIISFSVFKEKIESGEKCQTLRPYNEKRFKTFRNAKKYQLYWHNPRNGGKPIKEVEPVRFIPIIQFDPIFKICIFNEDPANLDYCPTPEILATNDGFKNFNEMLSWFLKEYGNGLYLMKFMVIRWLL